MILLYDKCAYLRKGKRIPSVPNSKYFCTLKNRFVPKDCNRNCEDYEEGKE